MHMEALDDQVRIEDQEALERLDDPHHDADDRDRRDDDHRERQRDVEAEHDAILAGRLRARSVVSECPSFMTLPFHVTATDPGSRARRGTITTSHGPIETPVFMDVGTRA